MNLRLKEVYEEDVSDRNSKISDRKLDNRDRLRKIETMKILRADKHLTALDYHHAALIFQHGTGLADFRKAHKLAKKAVELGDETAGWLAKASLDRSLLAEGKPQKFGTQFKIDISKT